MAHHGVRLALGWRFAFAARARARSDTPQQRVQGQLVGIAVTGAQHRVDDGRQAESVNGRPTYVAWIQGTSLKPSDSLTQIRSGTYGLWRTSSRYERIWRSAKYEDYPCRARTSVEAIGTAVDQALTRQWTCEAAYSR